MRVLEDWLTSYVSYASNTETPKIMHFWAGVSAVAGALRRHVWFDQVKFRWYPSFYIVFVAPPGIVSKSTTADIAMDLLKAVPGIKFGPDNATWQSMPASFISAHEAFEFQGEFIDQSPVTYLASELGNLIDLSNQEMMNLLITLWDGRNRYEKETKGSGNDSITCPWINLLGCTTPSWVGSNMASVAIGGGFTSRCVFLYADKKERFLPYLDEVTPNDEGELKAALINDLNHIASSVIGPMSLTSDARLWGKTWYEELWTQRPDHLQGDVFDGYIARKQTHLHKTAMILSAARGDTREITKADLMLANAMLFEAEQTMSQVFSMVGKSEQAQQAAKFIKLLETRGSMPYDQAYRIVHSHFPDHREFEGILTGLIRSGQVKLLQTATGFDIVPID